MARTWLIDGRGIARKVKNATQFSTYQNKDWAVEAHRHCPNCNHRIDNSDVSLEWPGLPSGVKFDPSDVELLEHLAGKVGLGNSKPHLFIDEFIPTLEEVEGICYRHPENLPGIKKDGSSVHFFHRTSNAYATGQRKRRKIHPQCCLFEERVRWHKTGKTRPIIENGVQKGCKKIMVLYKSLKKGSKPHKDNWVMHQYHLGTEEDEREGEFVVSKIFYQQQSKHVTEKSNVDVFKKESDMVAARVSPRTPKTNTPHPPRPGKHALYEVGKEKMKHLSDQDAEFISEMPQPSGAICLEDENANITWWAGESQGVEETNLDDADDSLLCNEILDFQLPFEESELKHVPYFPDVGCSRMNTHERETKPVCGSLDLDNIEVDTPPDFQLADLQFGSQESIMSWLDRF
ncbi:SUPPRESSOR OF GAMMA RESPONSE 1-like isoform X2 [Magnolia sinica]|uniref:SUPPRESSOR OF GAMMA RESPONSE 1-like isoform X2 n=1 Tax=Magnolia sinica TaxID=86752 RepID=UPI0026584B9B|nr:SUPPRESSOR OF GAMMA RESPONSE 1-like isoform X2 [Magnolia sinica]